MKKTLLLLVILAMLPLKGTAQNTKNIDSTAVFILDKMGDMIGELVSCSVHVENSIDTLNANKDLVKYYRHSEVKFSGPSKLVIQISGDEGQKGFWYDGSFLSYYNYDENNYVTLEAPETTLEMIDAMHKRFDFEFPAADFFYPTFVDDLLENFNTIQYLGTTMIDQQECFHIIATNSTLNVQFWIMNAPQKLPKRFLIIHKDLSNRQYESTFSNWDLNPSIPESVFEFLPPPDAKLISIMSKL